MARRAAGAQCNIEKLQPRGIAMVVMESDEVKNVCMCVRAACGR
jgi:hypothetical protein